MSRLRTIRLRPKHNENYNPLAKKLNFFPATGSSNGILIESKITGKSYHNENTTEIPHELDLEANPHEVVDRP